MDGQQQVEVHQEHMQMVQQQEPYQEMLHYIHVSHNQIQVRHSQAHQEQAIRLVDGMMHHQEELDILHTQEQQLKHFMHNGQVIHIMYIIIKV